jgi:two-component system sensor histidine kinase and response regulator WspE
VQDLAGGTILDSGEVAYIVDIESLLRSSSDYTGKSVVPTAKQEERRVRKRILIVEDSLTVRELERQTLENQGYEVVTAIDGLDGLNKVKSSPFDLIITDIEMPRMNGFEFLTQVKKQKNLKDIPAIIVSYREREEDKRKGIEVGADQYITKSEYNNKALLKAVANFLA